MFINPRLAFQPVSRGNRAAVRADAVRGPEAPRTPELEIPRPMGAGTARNDGTNVNLVGWLRKTPAETALV